MRRKNKNSPQMIIIQQPRQSQALPALVNIFLPGVGQLIQGRLLAWLFWWVVLFISVLLIPFMVGLVTTPLLWLVCILDAATYKG